MRQNSIAVAGLLLFPFARGVKKLRPAAKVEKEGTSDLQQRGAAEPFSSCPIDATYPLQGWELFMKSSCRIVATYITPLQGWELSYANFAAAVI